MDENKKKSPEEEKDKETPENPEQEKPEDKKDDPKPGDKSKDEKPEDKAPDDKQADENGEGASPEKEDEKPEDKPNNPEEKKDVPPAADPKDEEILKLKTQIAAMQMGFKPECMEDAVVLAESYVKSGAEKDINSALSAVMKKYSDWKADSKKSGGFKVGAGGADKQESADDDKLSRAFGIKKNKK